MKPAPFKYRRVKSLKEATDALAAAGGEAKLLAGGQSLVPMLNFRLVRPPLLVDINSINELDFIARSGGGLRIGALARHRTVETSALVAETFPVLAQAMTHVAHLAVRNRGTIGGSLSHADPAAELPLIALLLDASIEIAGASGRRAVPARDFFLAPLTTTLAGDEIVTAVELPALPAATGWGFEEFSLRRGDFAIAAVAATLTLIETRCVEARIAVIGGPIPVRVAAAEALLEGQSIAPQRFAEAARAARETVEPESSVHASAEFRAHLIDVLTQRALQAASARARSMSGSSVDRSGETG
jgi:CO/xanthine dehydrogenase FAD-binding subunit